jgi:hypothetical protein
MRPSIEPAALAGRAQHVIDACGAAGGNLGIGSGREAVEAGVDPLVSRGAIALEGSRIRVRDRNLLRYYARGLDHLLKGRGAGSPADHGRAH